MGAIQSWKFSAVFFVALAGFFAAFGNIPFAAVLLLIAGLFAWSRPGRTPRQRQKAGATSSR